MPEIKQSDVTWCCRFHPTDWFHEVGCPHQEWTKEQLLQAVIAQKKFKQLIRFGKLEEDNGKSINNGE